MLQHSSKKFPLEVAFILFGEKKDNGSIYLDELVLESLGNFSVPHNIEMMKKLVFQHSGKLKRQCKVPYVVFAHTHSVAKDIPPEFSNSWSFADIYASYFEAKMFKNICEVGHLLITPSMDTNLLQFSHEDNKFYRFEKGVIERFPNSSLGFVNPAYSDICKKPLEGKYREERTR